jgi:phosphoribosylformylglycinamidine synthase
MAMASGIGATVNQPDDLGPIPVFFGEDQGRYLLTVRDFGDIELFTQFMRQIEAAGIFAPWIGNTGGDALKLGEAAAISVTELRAAHEGWFPNYMSTAA